MVMPNTGVSFRAALFAGVVAGTVFQVVQKVYIFFQVGVAQYNAIYGSLAALPLFLAWLQVSWLVVLLGCEISFSYDNEEHYEFDPGSLAVSHYFKRLLALRITRLCIEKFLLLSDPVPLTLDPRPCFHPFLSWFATAWVALATASWSPM